MQVEDRQHGGYQADHIKAQSPKLKQHLQRIICLKNKELDKEIALKFKKFLSKEEVEGGERKA